ncbi:MAG: FkbM family methyltransferase [Alphaproteobacteria bacterium]|nr:FkbM family methyltransferase [Alphaproteobacteria bacterium]
MGIVSYAQNFEDVMLWRALGAEGPGFWIDVGAADPVRGSVTRAFHERGWRGINIEPGVQEFTALAANRANDINLNIALSDRPGTMTFYDCADAEFSTLDPAVAARHRMDGRGITERPVTVSTLSAICREHVREPIHFLKIDVEGAEKSVLTGADFKAFRPWIIVIEVTVLQHKSDPAGDCGPLLLEAGYREAWFDGLNRFYIAAEWWERLSRHFTVPPNVFDGFTLASSERSLQEIEIAKLRAENALLRLGAPTAQRTGGTVARLARRLRGFLSAELRHELTVMRQDIYRLALEVAALRRERQKGE